MKNYKKIFLAFYLLTFSFTSCLTAQEAENLTPEADEEETSIADEEIMEEIKEVEEIVPQEVIEGDIYPLAEHKDLELPGYEKELTQKWINYYLTPQGQKFLIKVLYDSVPYRPYIREQLEEHNMPLILQYLPVVESNYKATAVSKAGATGMWQFMENSMAPYLKKNSWYDERRDPWKSTIAAINKLSENYRIFEDWTIAIAAYNCGNGAMSRAIKKSEQKDFWYMAEHKILREQTIQYIPKLLAIAEIVENADYYGLIEVGAADKVIEDSVSQDYDYVTMSGMISLKEISRVTGIEEDTIKQLNPALFRNCTPAGESYNLRLPSGTGEEAAVAIQDCDSITDAIVYTVTKGDSLWGISRRYGVTVTDLCLVNNIREGDILSIGQKVIVPIFN